MKTYYLRFGVGDPRTLTGMNCTFLIFESAGVTLASPSITESLTGSGIYQFSWGTTTSIAFLADAATTSPGAALRYVTGSLDPSDRADEYGNSLVALGTTSVALGVSNFALGTSNLAQSVAITAQAVSILAQGVTNIAIGTSNIALGTTAVAIGTTLMGFGVSNVALGSSILSIIGTTASSFGTASTDPSTVFGYLKRLAELDQGQETFNKGTGVLTMLDRTGGSTLNQRTISNNSSLVIKT